MMTVWYEVVQRTLGDGVDITIFDCSGKLNRSDFPNARVQKMLNFYAATKSDEFLYHVARNRSIGWICDDDMFPMSPAMVDVLQREFAVENTASVSFRPREWWHYDIDGQDFEVSSSYCIAFNREIFCNREKLSLRPCDGNDHPSHIGKPPGRYDTGDKSNEILLQKGYRCSVVPEDKRNEYLTGFSGMSGAVMLLWHFKTPEKLLEYYAAPPDTQWSGNMLYGTLQALIAISLIQELYTGIKGQPYPLRSLPDRSVLESLLQSKKHLLRDDQEIDGVYEAGEGLRRVLGL